MCACAEDSYSVAWSIMSELEEGKPEEGLRNEVLASTARLQQQLLEAVDKLQQGKSDQNELQVREIPSRKL